MSLPITVELKAKIQHSPNSGSPGLDWVGSISGWIGDETNDTALKPVELCGSTAKAVIEACFDEAKKQLANEIPA